MLWDIANLKYPPTNEKFQYIHKSFYRLKNSVKSFAEDKLYSNAQCFNRISNNYEEALNRGRLHGERKQLNVINQRKETSTVVKTFKEQYKRIS